jgi:SAM-dependent methyltransferase
MRDLDCLALYEDAEFYDLEFRDRSDDVAFYRRWASAAHGPVLEIACGTGRITLPLARAGAAMTGLDVSEPMLARARAKAAAEGLAISWHLADARAFELGQRFDRVFMAANALQHLHDLESHQALFRCVRRHLAPGGRFVIDVFNPNVAKLARSKEVRYLFKTLTDGAGGPIRVEAASHYDDALQVLHFTLSYLAPGGTLLRTKEVAMRCLFPQELALLVRHAGFVVERAWGGHDERPFGPGAPKQILECRISDGGCTGAGPDD